MPNSEQSPVKADSLALAPSSAEPSAENKKEPSTLTSDEIKKLEPEPRNQRKSEDGFQVLDEIPSLNDVMSVICFTDAAERQDEGEFLNVHAAQLAIAVTETLAMMKDTYGVMHSTIFADELALRAEVEGWSILVARNILCTGKDAAHGQASKRPFDARLPFGASGPEELVVAKRVDRNMREINFFLTLNYNLPSVYFSRG